ncbi:protein tyrosine phosphatase [Actinoplanes sp. ATCC 53533]|uniref:tyrosine-protein phosphatase n=1 Tax=Actinoplanes sp. ATCC 53533 TaxID=1288362 RepID=UPI000F79E822|nr:tyrosine-protein phosphatase [Actinoplanes sp. ATCC 53533]RSM59380.1 protein tyrosine phosphatase [Actinoplanes sp. ATCC 53533]
MAVDNHPRSLTFSTSYNFRDVGGYAGLDGRTVSWRRLFRADSLHRLKGADLESFEALGVRTVIDLRRPFEVEEHGRVPESAGLDYRNLVVEHVDWESVEHSADIPHERWLADRYLNFAEDGQAGLAAALSVIADPAAAPAVVHCMAGKDRTGVVCALTLSLLGVSDADIAQDYALTEVAMASLTAYLLQTKPEMVHDKYHMFDCPQDAMLLFLADLRERHGSVEAYVREIGIGAEQLAALREHLLTSG